MTLITSKESAEKYPAYGSILPQRFLRILFNLLTICFGKRKFEAH